MCVREKEGIKLGLGKRNFQTEGELKAPPNTIIPRDVEDLFNGNRNDNGFDRWSTMRRFECSHGSTHVWTTCSGCRCRRTPLSLPLLQIPNEANIGLYTSAFSADEVEGRLIAHVVGVDEIGEDQSC